MRHPTGRGIVPLRAAAAAALLVTLVATTRVAAADAVTFVVVPERSRVEFVSGTQLGEFRGTTGAVAGEVVFQAASRALSRASIALDAGTLRSDNAARDRHMHEHLLEVARFPSVTFTAGEFRPGPAAAGGRGEGVLVGTLTLHGVARPVSVPVRYAVDGTTLQATGRFSLDLADFAMTPPRLLGLKVRNQVVIEAQLVATSR
jgi:polyisoprenoid-binding protein YceI